MKGFTTKSYDGIIINGLILIETEVFHDNRGFFLEAWNKRKFKTLISKDIEFVQDNFSQSQKGVLRGLHYQEEPNEQGKLVRCIHGEIFDVAVDIRKDSKTYGKYFSQIKSLIPVYPKLP